MYTDIIISSTDTTLSYELSRKDDILSNQYTLRDYTCSLGLQTKLTTVVLVNCSILVCTYTPSLGVPVRQGYLDTQYRTIIFTIHTLNLSYVGL